MVAIVAGKGLGLLNTSLNIVGAAGVIGQSVLGQGSSRAIVNAVSGNLVLQMQDEQLAGRGLELSLAGGPESAHSFSCRRRHAWSREGIMGTLCNGWRLSAPVAALAALTAVVLTACTEAPTRTEAASRATAVQSPWAAPTSTVRWNEYACELIARNQVGQFPALRTLAYLNVAINNAVVAARAKGVAPEGAAAGAAASILAFLFPKDEAAINSRLVTETNSLGATNYRPNFTAGVDVGRAAAADVVAMAKTDRSAAAWTGTVPTGEDKWSSRSQPPAPPLGPHFGSMRTFFMTNGAEFRSPPPPVIGSPAFKATLTEVRTISDGRTYEQLRIAQYWENLSGSFAAGLWNDVARQAISQHGLGEAESARVLALMHLAAFDAQIACHDSKYVYWVPRPTQLDPGIRLAIGVPNHPAYPSNHACISGAAGLVLDSQFPDAKGRYYAMGQQAGESRIYAGIHYRIDVDEGYVIARKVSARAVEVGIPTDRPFTPRGQ